MKYYMYIGITLLILAAIWYVYQIITFKWTAYKIKKQNQKIKLYSQQLREQMHRKVVDNVIKFR